MMKNRAGWLALFVLAVASLLMIFVVMPRIDQDGKSIGETINAAGKAVKDAVTENGEPQPSETATLSPQPPHQPDAQAPSGTAPSVAGAAGGQQAPEAARPPPGSAGSPAGQTAATAVTPSFDVLRVDPDGSTVIAGRATPNSTLEITSGSSIVARVDVGPSGDFAAVLDAPLAPGEHELVLKSTNKDGQATLSEETATISVPADKTGKLLAMVTKPGEASRLITVPDETAAAPATGAPNAGKATSSASDAPVAASASPDAARNALATPVAPSSTAALNAPLTAPPGLQISAVEIEGNQIFIAGKARAGLRVRGAADGTVVGEALAGQDGHFVIEGRANLSVGDHRISVQSLGAAGQPLLRVEVPFNRPAGQQVAAVAAPAGASMPASASEAIDGGRFERLRGEASKAFALLKNLYADGKVPTPEAMAAARSATGIALQSLAEYRLPAGAPVDATETVGAAARDAAAARKTLDALPRDVAAVGAALDNLSDMLAKTLEPAPPQQPGSAGPGATVASADDAPAAGASQTIQQAPLTPSDRSSVIIRRGDTLWQIARRVYGQGVRYTTIYLANEEQIGNPDIIQPGQIFGVPNDYRPDSESLHRERLMHRRL
jgi:nucleoid-associated protein YgaU